MTVDISRAVIGKNTDRAGAYVALTRGRTQNHAYVSDSIDLNADIEVHQLGVPRKAELIGKLRNHWAG